MAEELGATEALDPFTDEGVRGQVQGRVQGQEVLGLTGLERDALLAWVGENLPHVRRSATGQRVFYWILGIGFVLGLAAHVGGFLLKTSVTTEPLSLVADLLYALGWAMWTSVVVVITSGTQPTNKRERGLVPRSRRRAPTSWLKGPGFIASKRPETAEFPNS